jgi:hypothetical protein
MDKTCIIIGNGNSLKDVPNEWLDKYPTFGANRIYLKYIPTYYVCVNPNVIWQNFADIEALDCEKYVRAGMNATGYQLKRSLVANFSFQPLSWINEGYTVTYVSMQLAYWKGFTTVLLVGVDHRYSFEGSPNDKQKIEGDDPNHFDPDYFKGQEWQLPDLVNSKKYYRIAKEVFEGAGRKIINLTKDTALDVFEKGDYGMLYRG